MRRDGEFWDFFLADQLNMEPARIRALPGSDYVGLINYYQVKGVLTDLDARTAMNRA